MKSVYLLTGRPGVGKTSLIRQMATELKSRAGGFYTEEIRSQGSRLGFKLVTIDGRETILAHVDIYSRYRVGKYGVDIDNFDLIGVAAIHRATRESELVIIDEIGKMELFSTSFREAVLQLVRGGKRVLGTIMAGPNPWTDAIKRLPQVKVVEVTRNNHRRILDDIRGWLEEK